MTVARQAQSAAAGFTLLEMLLVLSILGVVAAIALPALTKPSIGLRLAAAAREIGGALRLARSTAIARNSEQLVLIDVERHSFGPPGAAGRFFPAEMQARLTVAETERLSTSRGGIRFFPDGSSTGGELALSLEGRQIKLCVHWLTGRPVEEGEC